MKKDRLTKANDEIVVATYKVITKYKLNSAEVVGILQGFCHVFISELLKIKKGMKK